MTCMSDAISMTSCLGASRWQPISAKTAPRKRKRLNIVLQAVHRGMPKSAGQQPNERTRYRERDNVPDERQERPDPDRRQDREGQEIIEQRFGNRTVVIALPRNLAGRSNRPPHEGCADRTDQQQKQNSPTPTA